MNISTTQTFQKLIEMLQSLERSGLKFVIQTPDGTTVHSQVLPGCKEAQRNKIDRGGVRLVDLFKDRLESMQPGQVEIFEVPADVKNLDPEAWRSAVSAKCVTSFGKGNYMTSMVPGSGAIEVFRVA